MSLQSSVLRVALVMAQVIMASRVEAQEDPSPAGKWEGIIALSLSSSDPVGVPGSASIGLENRDGTWRGSIDTGTSIDGMLKDLEVTPRSVRAALKAVGDTSEYALRLVVQGRWMWGAVTSDTEFLPGVKFARIYLRRLK
jgi:hypothetical protein